MPTLSAGRKVNMSRRQPNNVGVGYRVNKKGIEEIKKELGFHLTRPMVLSPEDQKDLDLKGDEFSDWYEEELRSFYESEDE